MRICFLRYSPGRRNHSFSSTRDSLFNNNAAPRAPGAGAHSLRAPSRKFHFFFPRSRSHLHPQFMFASDKSQNGIKWKGDQCLYLSMNFTDSPFGIYWPLSHCWRSVRPKSVDKASSEKISSSRTRWALQFVARSFALDLLLIPMLHIGWT